MKEIYLTRGYVAVVDDDDYDRINAMNWFAVVGFHIRAARHSLRKQIYMHHEVLRVLPWELNGNSVDHINGDPLDNRKSNLRIVSRKENMRNTRRHKERVGICFNKRANLWMAYLDEPDKKRKYLGYRKTKEEALALVIEARNA